MSRTKNVILNTFWVLLSQILTTILGLYSRKVFLSILGSELLGVNNLFSDVLALFSFADLGIGVAITFALYKPISDNDTDKINTLLSFFGKFYSIVIGVLIAISIAFFPFLSFLKTDIPINDIRIYYVVFQAGNLLEYLFVSKETYVIACQNERVLTGFNFIFTLLKVLLQILILKVTQNFLLYLSVGVALVLLRKIAIFIYINKRYPETRTRGAAPLPKSERKELFKKSGSMMVHKIGNLAINQTDSLIVSYMVSVAQWGLISNYLMIKNAVNSISTRIYSAFLPSFGNLVATEKPDKHLHIFYLYDFINFWIYAFCFVGLAVLSSPFISLFFGVESVVGESIIFLLFLAFLIDGFRNPVSILREASGAIEKDKWYTILAAVINLVVSIVLVIYMGVAGIYIGTILAMIVLIISRTIILFKSQYGISPRKYFLRILLHLIMALIGFVSAKILCYLVQIKIGLSVGSFILMLAIVCVVPNLLWILLSLRRQEFKELIERLKVMLRRKDKEKKDEI